MDVCRIRGSICPSPFFVFGRPRFPRRRRIFYRDFQWVICSNATPGKCPNLPNQPAGYHTFLANYAKYIET